MATITECSRDKSDADGKTHKYTEHGTDEQTPGYRRTRRNGKLRYVQEERESRTRKTGVDGERGGGVARVGSTEKGPHTEKVVRSLLQETALL